ncbi:unnamed protein product [Parnassius apollo]|uniref:(apollo) hypothetical protein n=1 Tax=Parnassius apollo TaxID=110799 RepID=A0A8S3XUW3_PARAO|nr:unnamed protein product [Parnassius apollo]
MARKGQIVIQDSVETNEEFEEYLAAHYNQLICMEVYSDFCGPCLATGNAIRKGKLEIGQDNIAMVKMGKLTRAMFGANGIELGRLIVEELGLLQAELETGLLRAKQEISEMLPEESAKREVDAKLQEETREARERLRMLTLAARKKRIAERLARHVRRLNYIMYWPHCHRAHIDLYEKWDHIRAKELVQLTEEGVKEVLYMSDVEPNEACLHALMDGEVLVVLFKMFDTDNRDFVRIRVPSSGLVISKIFYIRLGLLRHALYEEIPVPKEDVPPEKQVPLVPAYERYAAVSKTAREVRRERYEAKMQKLREEREERERLAAEQARLAREAEEERLLKEKQRQEEERMARIQAGLPADPEPEAPNEEVAEEVVEEKVVAEEVVKEEVVEEVVEEEVVREEPTEEEAEQEKVEEEEEFHSDVSVEGEDYIPPGGLFVPGLYTPPNDLAKANGLAFFFPKLIQDITASQLESEFLPPHVLVMFPIDKRHEVREAMQQFPADVLYVARDDVRSIGDAHRQTCERLILELSIDSILEIDTLPHVDQMIDTFRS